MGGQTGFDVDITQKDATIPSIQNLARAKQRNSVSSSQQMGISQNSILPSLSSSNQHTPRSGSPTSNDAIPGRANADVDKANSAEEFFYGHKARGTGDSLRSMLTDNLNEKLGPQFIQPRSRYNNTLFQSLVVDPKKENEDVGLPSMKINRSSNNLSALNNSSFSSYTNLLGLNSAHNSSTASIPGSSRQRQPVSKTGFTLNANSSATSIPQAINEEQEGVDDKSDDEDFSENFNDMICGRSETKLAPFGGFSKPDLEDGIWNQDNIFEDAPWKVVFAGKGNVSLTKAIKIAADAGVIKNRKWVGTIAMPSDAVPDSVIHKISETLSEDYNSEAVFPNDMTFQGHYKSFCKQILWPTLHYQIPDDPKSKAFEDHSWGHYQLLNQLVADKLVEVYKKENGTRDPNDPENMIWIHDYHLLLVPRMVREKLPEVKIGLFLHVSFPSSEVFRCFAQRKALLRGMLGANCITFQTDEYVRHFWQTCNRLLLADANEFGITYEGKFTMINTIPVGVDAKSLQNMLSSTEVDSWRQMIRERWGDQHLIVSRDKLDKLRGIKQKLLAYEKFLLGNPDYIDTTVLIQICPGSTQDSSYESEIMAIVARINSLTSDISFAQPVVLLQQDIGFDQYLALQCEADVFVVSSMREGLNLTCHEYIIATTEKKSPLMLSEFTGSSPLLNCNGEGAILINPWDLKKFAELFKALLNMSKEEKLKRWTNCYETIFNHDSRHWVVSCLSGINESWEYDQRRSLNNLIPFTRHIFDHFYNLNDGGKRLFFLNLETPSAISAINDPNSKLPKLSSTSAVASVGKSSAISEPSRFASLLNELLADPLNHVYLTSYMKRSDLDTLYRRSPNLGLIAENGGYIKLTQSSKWISIVDELELKSWMPQVSQLIESKVERLPGSYIEVEDCTIRFHPGNSFEDDHERSLDVMGDCIQHINELFEEKDGLHATLIRNVVVVQQNQLSLKALKFIISYYNQKKQGIKSESLIEEYQVKQVPGSTPSTPSTPISETASLPPIASPGSKVHKNIVSALFLSGGSTPIDEPSFEYADSLKQDGEMPEVLTVAVLGIDSRTSATYSVAGKNELLGILSNPENHEHKSYTA